MAAGQWYESLEEATEADLNKLTSKEKRIFIRLYGI